MRVTAIALVPLSVAFVIVIVALLGKDYAAARAFLGQPFPALVMLLFILAGIYHMNLGMHAVIDDYVHDPKAKEHALLANLAFAVSIGLVCVYATLKLSFG